jgi:hypothetical protein
VLQSIKQSAHQGPKRHAAAALMRRQSFFLFSPCIISFIFLATTTFSLQLIHARIFAFSYDARRH